MTKCKHCNKEDYLYLGYDLCVPCIIYLEINRKDYKKYKNDEKPNYS